MKILLEEITDNGNILLFCYDKNKKEYVIVLKKGELELLHWRIKDQYKALEKYERLFPPQKNFSTCFQNGNI